MKVAQLIRELQKIPNQELPVRTEGCDCYGNSYRVSYNARRVVIERDDYTRVEYENADDTPYPLSDEV